MSLSTIANHAYLFISECLSFSKNKIIQIGSFCGKTVLWIRDKIDLSEKINFIANAILSARLPIPHLSRVDHIPGPIYPPNIPPEMNVAFQQAFDATTKFAGYRIKLPDGHPCQGASLTSVTFRPANLFFAAVFNDSPIETTMPDSGQLFAFNAPHAQIREYLEQKAENNEVVEFSALGVPGRVKMGVEINVDDLSELYGNNVYRISFEEIKRILDSQKIYTSSLLPLPFYKGLKQAMLDDQIVILPGNDAHPILLRDLGTEGLRNFLNEVRLNFNDYGFASIDQYDELCEMTIYQIGSMVVKSEDFHIFMDGNGKILAREPGMNDAIRLINSCGIRGFHSPITPSLFNRKIMTENFKTDLIAAESGIAIFPAVGMGVWRGNPEVYWKGMLDAIIFRDYPLDLICVNPGHQQTAYGIYQGCRGEEFKMILDEYKARYANQPNILARLEKVVNLHASQKDIVQLAHQLKLAFPEKIISLFNASDPDVSLGYHVGEYVNNCPHTYTTEENYTAMGTNGICFEGITKVHAFPERLIQT